MISDAELILESAARLAVPLAFVGLGELIAEKSGALNISVEGAMLAGAFGAVVGSDVTGSAVGGLIAGVGCGLLVALVQAFLSHALTVNQFVVGLSLNVFVLGLTSFLHASIVTEAHQFGVFRIPVLADIPLMGEALFAQRVPFYAVYLLIPATWWLLNRTRWGLEVQAVGENPEASAVSGLDVGRLRRQATILGGACAGFGGAYLSIGAIGAFSQNMAAGRGYVAIAAVIFGGWTVRGTVLGCALFGLMDALRLALPAIGIELNPQLLIASPYLMALLAMLLFNRSLRQPRALGLDFARRPA